MTRSPIMLSALIILGSAQSSEGDAVKLLDYGEIQELTQTGLAVGETATYGVWVWARGGSSVRIGIGETGLSREGVSEYRPYSWVRAGRVELTAGETYGFELEARAPGEEDPGRCVGWLALSTEEGFDPQRAWELMRVHPHRVGPVADARVRESRSTRTSFHFPEYETREEWEARREEVRRKILVSAGLWPLPERGPLNVKVVETLDREGYTIEKLHMETWPGVYFPGALYRPKGKTGPFPAIIAPHGHGKLGRMATHVQARCANFALQGYIAFSYNMIGYVDNDQMQHKFQSDEAYLWSVSVGGLQLWNSIRALDFVTSLPDVDPERVGCTGASGGGTQTFLVTAVDDRVKAAAPVCMVSSFFQGGCICENAPGLRLDTYNVEIAACTAPRPLILVGATGDWTDLTPEVEYPDVRGIYGLLGDEEKVTYYYQDAGHNYDENSRAAVYRWFGKWLLGEEDEVKLQEVETVEESVEELRVFDEARGMPDDALDQEGIFRARIAEAKELLDRLWPENQAELDEYQKTMRPALADVLDVREPEDVRATIMSRRSTAHARRGAYDVMAYILGRPGAGDEVPAVLYTPKGAGEGKTVTLVVHPEGKAALVDFARGEPVEMVKGLLDKGQGVLAIDTFLTGEHHSPFGNTVRERYGRYFSTFHAADEALRVQDIVTAVAYLRHREDVAEVNLVGLGEAGLWCLLARGLTDGVGRTAVDVVGLDTDDDAAWVEHLNVPGILRVGGLDGAMACGAPGELLIHNAGGKF
ncbi:MAG: acetylxylan esterase, partial [Armatimonadota bacterium]